jgi:hypothetical protein
MYMQILYYTNGKELTVRKPTHRSRDFTEEPDEEEDGDTKEEKDEPMELNF